MDPVERLKEETEETLNYLRNTGLTKADIGVVLGFGLEKASQTLVSARSINLESIPNFPIKLSYGYGKRLLFAEVSRKRVVLLEGHFNLFEGYTARSVAYPVWILSQLGIKTLLYLTEGFALGGGEEGAKFVLAEDHLSFIDENPVFGMTGEEDSIDLKFSGEIYSSDLLKILGKILEEKKVPWKKGVVAFKRGPILETKAEARFLRKVGADLVCYSGYPEVATAVALGLKLAFLAIITSKFTRPVSRKDRMVVIESQVPLVKEALKKFIRKVEVDEV